eukprot:10337208-Prorocentrum_lima.AAC.1
MGDDRRHVPMDAIAETNAKYLQNQHWQSHLTPAPIDPIPIIADDPTFVLSDFTQLDLDWAIRSLKRNKAPGPDGVAGEWIKEIPEDNRDTLLA